MEEVMIGTDGEIKQMYRFLVFIRKEYVINSQAYIGNQLPENEDSIFQSDDKKEYWKGIKCDILVMDTIDYDEVNVLEKVKQCYNTADTKIFRIMKAGKYNYNNVTV